LDTKHKCTEYLPIFIQVKEGLKNECYKKSKNINEGKTLRIQAAKGMPSKLLLYIIYTEVTALGSEFSTIMRNRKRKKKIRVMNKFTIHGGARESEKEEQ